MTEGQYTSGCSMKEEDNSICIKQEEFTPVYKEDPDNTPGMFPVKLEPQDGSELPHYPGCILGGTSECKPDVTNDVQYATDLGQSAAYVGDTKEFINTDSMSCAIHDTVSQTACRVEKTKSPREASYTTAGGPSKPLPCLLHGLDESRECATVNNEYSIISSIQYQTRKRHMLTSNKDHTAPTATPVEDYDGRPFKCDKCVKSFGKKTELTRHIRVHTGDKQHKCDQCMKSFSRNCYLVKHIRTLLVKSLTLVTGA
jgi:hypothetical protein